MCVLRDLACKQEDQPKKSILGLGLNQLIYLAHPNLIIHHRIGLEGNGTQLNSAMDEMYV